MRTYPMSLVSTLEHLTIRMDALAIYSYSSGPKVSSCLIGTSARLSPLLLPGANPNEARTHLGLSIYS